MTMIPRIGLFLSMCYIRLNSYLIVHFQKFGLFFLYGPYASLYLQVVEGTGLGLHVKAYVPKQKRDAKGWCSVVQHWAAAVLLDWKESYVTNVSITAKHWRYSFKGVSRHIFSKAIYVYMCGHMPSLIMIDLILQFSFTHK
jgi:hypothetical protein